MTAPAQLQGYGSVGRGIWNLKALPASAGPRSVALAEARCAEPGCCARCRRQAGSMRRRQGHKASPASWDRDAGLRSTPRNEVLPIFRGLRKRAGSARRPRRAAGRPADEVGALVRALSAWRSRRLAGR